MGFYLFALPAEHLASVDDQVSKAGARRQKFSNDDAYQGKADVDIHNAQQQRDTAGDHRHGQAVFFRASKSPDECQTFSVHIQEAAV